jgi:heat shock protein HtpX
MSVNIYNNISSNKQRTAVLLLTFLLVIISLGWVFSRAYNAPIILYLAVAISLAQALVGYYSGDKVALTLSGAREINKSDNPELFRTVENLAITAGLPMPRLYIINDASPNAFATGRDPQHSSIAVTTGLLEILDKSELEGVLAHELSHIGNYDIRLMTLVVVLVSVIALLSDIFLRVNYIFGRSNDRNSGNFSFILAVVAAILAPIVATLIQLAISRKREFLADASGVMLTRYPDGLASALNKISAYGRPMRRVSSATSHLFISNPKGKTKSFLANLFSTHPPVEERIKALTGEL